MRGRLEPPSPPTEMKSWTHCDMVSKIWKMAVNELRIFETGEHRNFLAYYTGIFWYIAFHECRCICAFCTVLAFVSLPNLHTGVFLTRLCLTLLEASACFLTASMSESGVSSSCIKMTGFPPRAIRLLKVLPLWVPGGTPCGYKWAGKAIRWPTAFRSRYKSQPRGEEPFILGQWRDKAYKYVQHSMHPRMKREDPRLHAFGMSYFLE